MKYEANQFRILKVMVDKLACGIDPTSMIAFPHDTILNNNLLKRCFSEISEILEYLEYNFKDLNDIPHKNNRNQKSPFHVLENEVSKIPICKTPISVSKFTYKINEVINHYGMRKLKATQITSWLEKNGYLYITGSEDTGYYKIATELGLETGITTEKKRNSDGNDYATNLYNSNAQNFIVININGISQQE